MLGFESFNSADSSVASMETVSPEMVNTRAFVWTEDEVIVAVHLLVSATIDCSRVHVHASTLSPAFRRLLFVVVYTNGPNETGVLRFPFKTVLCQQVLSSVYQSHLFIICSSAALTHSSPVPAHLQLFFH